MGGTGPDNLNLVEMDQPVEQKRQTEGPGRKQKLRFRPEKGFAGNETENFEGGSGYRNQHSGYGTENPSDVGVPGIFAAWKKKRMPEPEATMPNANRESDPLEEKQGLETTQSFYDMQAR